MKLFTLYPLAQRKKNQRNKFGARSPVSNLSTFGKIIPRLRSRQPRFGDATPPLNGNASETVLRRRNRPKN